MTRDLSAYRKLIVFGGTFDPPHRAHVELPRRVMQLLGAQGVLYIPAAKPPHKLDAKQTAAEHRLAMLERALRDFPEAMICTDELDRAHDGQPSYTVDTLRSLRERLPPQAVMRLLIGADQVRIFGSWRESEAVVQLAEPVVMVRPPDTPESLLESLPENERETWAPRLVELPSLDISSTDIRAELASGQSQPNALDPAVAAYIAEHGLYQS